MAYNYDDFMKTAGNAGMLGRFSKEDLSAVQKYPEFGYSMLQMYQNRDKATTAEQRLLADETANQLRKSYGVTPGQTASIGTNVQDVFGQTKAPTYGNIPGVTPAQKASVGTNVQDVFGQTKKPTYGNIPGVVPAAGPASIEADTLALYERMSKPGTVPAGGGSPVITGSFDAMNASAGSTKSQTSVNSKTSKSTATGPAFDYDPEQDPRMAAYRKTYLREAERAREDTLAKAAAATGGIPSSYAIGAADQAGNYFVSQLTDKIPELYNDAYNQQLQEWEKAMAIYQIMGDNTPQEYLDVLGVKKKKKKKDSGGSSGSTAGKPKEENEDSGSGVGTPEFDMSSVVGLNQGPISGENLGNQISAGVVVPEVSGNTIKVSQKPKPKVPSTYLPTPSYR